MSSNPVAIKISKENKIILQEYIAKDVKESDPLIENVTMNTSITYLLKKYMGFNYDNAMSKIKNGIK